MSALEAMADEVNDLARQALQAVLKASTPAAALNALLTAYINLADSQDVLDTVPSAGHALGEAARTLMALRTSGAPAAPSASSPLH